MLTKTELYDQGFSRRGAVLVHRHVRGLMKAEGLAEEEAQQIAISRVVAARVARPYLPGWNGLGRYGKGGGR